MKGIALTSVDGTIPAEVDGDLQAPDITKILYSTIQSMGNGDPAPTYQELYDKIDKETKELNKQMTYPSGKVVYVDYIPKMYLTSQYVDPAVAKFLEPFP